MDRRIRMMGLLLLVCFGLLFLQLNNWQVVKSSQLQSSPYEQYAVPTPNEFSEPRGDIISSDGVVLAQSVTTDDGFGELRKYPLGSLTVDATGYYDTTQQASSGLESYYNSSLVQHQGESNNLQQLITAHNGTDNVVTTLNVALQKVAAAELAAHGPLGAVVAINPQTGAILAMYSNPTFNPNILSSHNATAVAKAYKTLQNLSDPSNSPLINGATETLTHPGSTMKVITTSAMFDKDFALTQMTWPAITSTKLPGTNSVLHNFDSESCGGSLAQILAKSCDTAYGLIGVDLGAENIVNEADAFGFNKVPPIDLRQYGETEAVASQINLKDLLNNPPYQAYSAIGQGNVGETVLQDAMVAAAIGNNGIIMTPHLMSRIVSDDGTVLQTYKPHAWLNATSGATADEVRNLMLGVTVSPGTAAGLFPASDQVAAKTGTAETLDGCSANWLIATGPAGEGSIPKIAVAAEVPHQAGQACNETGAEVAGPIVAAVLEAGLQEGL